MHQSTIRYANALWSAKERGSTKGSKHLIPTLPAQRDGGLISVELGQQGVHQDAGRSDGPEEKRDVDAEQCDPPQHSPVRNRWWRHGGALLASEFDLP